MLADPDYLPFRLDWRAGRILFLRSRRDILDAAAFLDGRTPISIGEEIVAPVGPLMERAPAIPSAPRRFILHVGFCGSTALARACSLPGTALSLKEPQILVDLANWRAEPTCDVVHHAQTCQLVLDLLFRRFRQDEAVIVKPTNWANTILPDLLAKPGTRAIRVTLPAPDFLSAVLDGGRERLRFSGELAVHYGRRDPVFAERCEMAIRDVEPLQAALRLAALVHAFQIRTFSAVRSPSPATISFEQILAAPCDTAAAALDDLGITPDRHHLDAHVESALTLHSKQNGEGGSHFSVSSARVGRQTTSVRYAAQIEAALDWAKAA